MESFSLPTFVQCLDAGLPANTYQEWMLLKSSENSGERIKIQLRPFELIRLGPFHLTFVAAKDVLQPSMSNFYRLAPGIESCDYQQATEPSGVQEQPLVSEMPFNPTSYSTTSVEHPFEHVSDQSQVDACQTLAGSSSVKHAQYSEPVMDILDPNSVADARILVQSDNVSEVSPNDAPIETAEESGGNVCHDIDTQDSMLPSIQIKTPAPLLNTARDTARGALANCVGEVSRTAPQASPPSERKSKGSVSPSSRPRSPAIRTHFNGPEAAHAVMPEHEPSEMVHPPPEISPVSEEKKTKKRSVSPLSTRQRPIKKMRSNSFAASDEEVAEHGETEVAHSPLRITPLSEQRKKRQVARSSISESPINSTQPRDLMASDVIEGEPASDLQKKRSVAPASMSESPVTSTRSSDLKASGKPRGGQGLRVLFASSSTIDESSAHIKFLREQRVQVVKDVRKCTVLCIGAEGFKKTSKFIMAVLLGLPITTDEWILQSVQAGKMLEVDKFVARDAAREAEWGFDLGESVLRAEKDHEVFESWTIMFTPAAKKSAGKTAFDELKSLALAAGAQDVSAADGKKIVDRGNKAARLLIIAASKDPAVIQLGVLKCFSQEIVGMSILRGVLDLSSDEFLQK